MNKVTVKSFFAIIFGIIIGIFLKWGDIMPGDNIITYFGWISTGIIIWLFIGSLLIIKSKNRKEFSIVYLLFMMSMLASYYLFSAIIVKYLYTKIIIFWIIMFMASLVFGNIIFNKRYTNIFRVLYVLASIVFLIYDAIEINGISLQAIIPELLLTIFILLLINKNIKNNS